LLFSIITDYENSEEHYLVGELQPGYITGNRGHAGILKKGFSRLRAVTWSKYSVNKCEAAAPLQQSALCSLGHCVRG
jgi:hypothetical protein